MRGFYLIPGVIMLSACEQTGTMTGDCGASAMQSALGQSAIAAYELVQKQSESVRDNAYYVGRDEVFDGAIPQNALIIETSAKSVHDPQDLVGQKVTRIYCHVPNLLPQTEIKSE